jgi:uncharacterized protein
VGVHQDGLVHISAMSKTFVKDPRAVAKPGDIVKVKVLEVDPNRKRISLSMRLDDSPDQRQAPGGQRRDGSGPAPRQRREEQPKGAGALGEALLAAMRGPQKNAR